MIINNYNLIFNEEKLPTLLQEATIDAPEILTIDKPIYAVEVLNKIFHARNRTEEEFYVIAFRTSAMIGVFKFSMGTMSQTCFTPAEIFRRLLILGANSYIIAHNHPSGSIKPSKEDNQATERIKRAGDILGITMLDHIIIGDSYYSYRENCEFQNQ